MIPSTIVEYLHEEAVPFQRYPHRLAVTGQELAESIDQSGFCVAKTVLLEVDEVPWMAVIPSATSLDLRRAVEVAGGREARLLREQEFERRFPDCEVGAEPPFGSLFGVSMMMDSSLAEQDVLFVRAGSHTEALAMLPEDLIRLERPRMGAIAVLPATRVHPGTHELPV